MKVLDNTGLKDKNGKEIYEGDILKHIFTVKNYDDDDYHLENRFSSQYETRTSYLEVKYFQGSFIIYSDTNFSETEIVGNIHENIDLLKK